MKKKRRVRKRYRRDFDDFEIDFLDEDYPPQNI